MEKFKGYRTYSFFGLLLVIAVANFFGFVDWKPDADMQEVIDLAIPVIGLILRKITK